MPSPARLYDYYLGGTINFPADQEAAERIREDLPEISGMAWANPGFHQRAAKWLAAGRGGAADRQPPHHLRLRGPAGAWPGGAPRLVYLGEWGAEDPTLADSDGSRWGYAGVARRP